MPVYEYRCRTCGDTFEALRSMSAADEPVACRCGAEDTARIPSVPARAIGGDGASAPAGLPMAPSGGSSGGCCGGGCCG